MNVILESKVHDIACSKIAVVGKRRGINEATVTALMESIRTIGLRTPITVRKEEGTERYILVAGLHRLDAFRRLNRWTIPAVVTEDSLVQAELWEISENVDRAEPTALERNSLIARRLELTGQKPGHVGHLSGGRGKAGGVSGAAKDIGVPRTAARRAVAISGLSDEAKQVARETGLDDNQTALLKAAKEPKAEDQVRVLQSYPKPASGAVTSEETEAHWRGELLRVWDRGAKIWQRAILPRLSNCQDNQSQSGAQRGSADLAFQDGDRAKGDEPTAPAQASLPSDAGEAENPDRAASPTIPYVRTSRLGRARVDVLTDQEKKRLGLSDGESREGEGVATTEVAAPPAEAPEAPPQTREAASAAPAGTAATESDELEIPGFLKRETSNAPAGAPEIPAPNSSV